MKSTICIARPRILRPLRGRGILHAINGGRDVRPDAEVEHFLVDEVAAHGEGGGAAGDLVVVVDVFPEGDNGGAAGWGGVELQGQVGVFAHVLVAGVEEGAVFGAAGETVREGDCVGGFAYWGCQGGGEEREEEGADCQEHGCWCY